MTIQHKQLAAGRWNELSFCEQMANTGSEIERAVTWRKKGNTGYGNLAFERALELLFLTMNDRKNKTRLRELARVHEVLADHFVFDNTYQSTDESWQKYFFSFTYAARAHK
jgi:hypothetical protein